MTQMENSQHLYNCVRICILTLMDLPFILVTGKNANGEIVTIGELVDNLDLYKRDLSTLVESWGSDHPLLQPIGYAVCQVQTLQYKMDSLYYNPSDPVRFFIEHPDNKEKFCLLTIEIAKALNVFGENAYAR